ncbi:MAG: hypothetical protein ABI569_11475, partial [Casimicrobiaceae bacterium]
AEFDGHGCVKPLEKHPGDPSVIVFGDGRLSTGPAVARKLLQHAAVWRVPRASWKIHSLHRRQSPPNREGLFT